MFNFGFGIVANSKNYLLLLRSLFIGKGDDDGFELQSKVFFHFHCNAFVNSARSTVRLNAKIFCSNMSTKGAPNEVSWKRLERSLYESSVRV